MGTVRVRFIIGLCWKGNQDEYYVPSSVLSKSERKIIVTGGFLDGKYSDRVESYDVDGGYWEVLVGPQPVQDSFCNAISHPNRATEPFTLLEPRMDHSCIVATSSTPARNGSFVVVSGGGNELGILNTTETRDPDTYQWTKAKPDTGESLSHELRCGLGLS